MLTPNSISIRTYELRARAPGDSTRVGPKPPGSSARHEVERAFISLDHPALRIRIVPAFRDGVPQGFKLFGIQPDSPIARLGLAHEHQRVRPRVCPARAVPPGLSRAPCTSDFASLPESLDPRGACQVSHCPIL